jgi:glycine betaine/proline transport system permease protein
LDWLLLHLGEFFDSLGEGLDAIVETITSLLVLPTSIALILLLAAIPLAFRRWGIAIFAVLAFALIDAMGLWEQTMQSLAVVLVATAAAAAIGVPLGILSARRRRLSVALRPVLDLMQTTPSFVYLIPAVFFFGVGVVPGVVATVIFALAPAVRLTELGIRQVDPEAVEAALAFGSRPGQLLRDVQLPLALPTIMAGINQVIMLALSMVVVAGLAGAQGLGAVVTSAVTQLDVGAGIEGGLAVVILAIYLDRLTSAFSGHRRRRSPRALSEAAPADEEGASEPVLTAAR